MEVASEVTEAIARAVYAVEFQGYGLAKASDQQRQLCRAALRKFSLKMQGIAEADPLTTPAEGGSRR